MKTVTFVIAWAFLGMFLGYIGITYTTWELYVIIALVVIICMVCEDASKED